MKNSKNVLIASISGIVACLVCVGVVFLFPKSSNQLKNNNVTPNSEYELTLGDCNSCMNSCLIDESEEFCASMCADDCATTAPTTAPTQAPTTAPVCNDTSMRTANSCFIQAQDDCAPNGFTGCNSQDSNGCYSYTCNAAPTQKPTTAPTTAPTATATPIPTKVTCWYVNGYFCSSAEYSAPSCGRAGYALYSDEATCRQHLPVASPGITPTPAPQSGKRYCWYWGGGTCYALETTDMDCTGGSRLESTCRDSHEVVDCYEISGNTCVQKSVLRENCLYQSLASCTASLNHSTVKKCYYARNDVCVGEASTDPSCAGGYESLDECSSNLPKCKIESVSTTSNITSIHEGKIDENSFYIGIINTSGNCAGVSIPCITNNGVASSTAGKLSGSETSSTSLLGIAGKNQYECYIYPEHVCVPSTVSSKINSVGDSDTVSRIKYDWEKTTVCEKNPDYTNFLDADENYSDHYYSGYGKCPDGSQGYTEKWMRTVDCGDSPYNPVNPSTPVKTPTPTTTPSAKYDFCCVKNDGSSYSWRIGQSSISCPSGYTVDYSKNKNTCKTVAIPACYKDGDDNYHWTVDPQPSWVKVPDISREADCKKDESPACYKDPNGEYKWGKHAKDPGYTLITSINSETECRTPAPEEACYKSPGDQYIWTSNPPSGYTKVTSATKPEECVPPEEPACYVHGQDFVWGKYSNVNGYIKLDGIDSEDKCKLPKDDACYEDPNGEYVWGEFSNDAGYTLVSSILDINLCGIDVPTPKTSINVSTIIYIFMAILMLFGIGFIYYSSIIKKNN